MPFVKLKRANDWGVDFYSRNPYGDSQWGTVSIRNAEPLLEGQRVRIRFPHGEPIEVELKNRRRRGGYSDMGRATSFEYDLLGFVVNYNGAECWFDLDAVEIDLPELVKP